MHNMKNNNPPVAVIIILVLFSPLSFEPIINALQKVCYISTGIIPLPTWKIVAKELTVIENTVMRPRKANNA